jgi:hypothetical protein
MKDIVESIKKTNHSEWHTVQCIKEYKIDRKTGTITFKQGEEYEASKINDNWWLIEQFGVSTEDFKKYFKDV